MKKIQVIDIAFSGNSANADRVQDEKILSLTAKIEKIVAYKYFTCVINDERTNSLYWCKIPVNRLLKRFRNVGSKVMVAKPFSIKQAYELINSEKLVKLCNRDEIEQYKGDNYGVKVQTYLEKRFRIKFDRTVSDLDGAEWRGTEVKYWNAIKSSTDATFSSVDTIEDRYNKLLKK